MQASNVYDAEQLSVGNVLQVKRPSKINTQAISVYAKNVILPVVALSVSISLQKTKNVEN